MNIVHVHVHYSAALLRRDCWTVLPTDTSRDLPYQAPDYKSYFPCPLIRHPLNRESFSCNNHKNNTPTQKVDWGHSTCR